MLGELSCSVDRIREELVGGMEEKRVSVETRGEGLVTRLEAELSQLQVRRSRLEAQATSDDHIGFLQVRRECVLAEAPFIICGCTSFSLSVVTVGWGLHFEGNGTCTWCAMCTDQWPLSASYQRYYQSPLHVHSTDVKL